jgi:CheY-like chemotaxis protein
LNACIVPYVIISPIKLKHDCMKQIIIADDDLAIRDVFNIILKRAGYNVTVYANGEVLMGSDYEVPDLFIVDKQLSGMDGLEVCHFLKNQESTKTIPVILISASPYVSRFAKDAGADDFIEKPFKTKSLIAVVEKHLNKSEPVIDMKTSPLKTSIAP